MLEVVTLAHFANPKRVAYLERGFGSFYRFQTNVRHLVFDSSPTMVGQEHWYRKFGIELVHLPGAPYGERLRRAADAVKGDYFLFLPDDFEWVFDFPLTTAIMECRRFGIDELKLTCRGQDWFSRAGVEPTPWFQNGRVVSGEQLVRQGDLFVSHRRWFKDFHEQFSLACNLLRTDFFRWTVQHIPRSVKSPGQAEKHAYLRLAFHRYWVAYYRMWIPAFHFIDLGVEGDTPLNRVKLGHCLHPDNIALYNQRYNV